MKFSLRPVVGPNNTQAFLVECNGKVFPNHGLPITTFAKLGEIEQALNIVAARPNCHDLCCAGCPEGWASEIARGEVALGGWRGGASRHALPPGKIMNGDILDSIVIRRTPDAERAQRALVRMLFVALVSFTIFTLMVL